MCLSSFDAAQTSAPPPPSSSLICFLVPLLTVFPLHSPLLSSLLSRVRQATMVNMIVIGDLGPDQRYLGFNDAGWATITDKDSGTRFYVSGGSCGCY